MANSSKSTIRQRQSTTGKNVKSNGITSHGMKSTSTSHSKTSNPNDDKANKINMILALSATTHLYCIVWCLALFLPLLDTMLFEHTKHFDGTEKDAVKFIVAVDHRPITYLDLTILMPINGLIVLLYALYVITKTIPAKTFNSTFNDDNRILWLIRLAVVAHIIDTVIRWIRMPEVWDHEQWAVVCNTMFVACYLSSSLWNNSTNDSKRNLDATHLYWLRMSGLLLGILYAAAAFWKLTTSFYNVPTSCGSSLVLETIITYWFPPREPVPYHIAELAVYAGPHLTFFVESGLALGMIYISCTMNPNRRSWKIIRNITVVTAAIFHLTIYMLPVNAAGGFSLDCMTRLLFFFHPMEIYTVLLTTDQYSTFTKTRAWTVMTILWVRFKGTGYPPDFGFVFFCMLLDLYLVIMFPNSSTSKHDLSNIVIQNNGAVSSTTTISANLNLCFGIIYGFVLTTLGLEQMGAPTMYSNLRSYYGGNHLLVRTGVLGDDILYGGGLVQVAYSTCDTLNKMLGYINASYLEPEGLYMYQKSLLRNSSIVSSPIQSDSIPIQFLPLCVGNPHSGKLLADYYRRSNPLGQPAIFQYILPVNAVKRALQKARQNNESFVVKLSDAGKSSLLTNPIPIDNTTILVVLDENGNCKLEKAGISNIDSNTTLGCNDDLFGRHMMQVDELSSWMDYLVYKFLIPYPQIVGEPEEVCMS